MAIAEDANVGDAIFGFHARRSAVKLIEAVLSSRAMIFTRGDLVDLIATVEQGGIAAPAELIQAKALARWTQGSLYEHLDAPEIDRAAIVAPLANLRMWTEQQIGASTTRSGPAAGKLSASPPSTTKSSPENQL